MNSKLYRWILLRFAALSLVVFGVSVMPGAAQAEDGTPPAPTFVEVCGTMDEVYIPPVDGVTYYRDTVGGTTAMAEGVYHPLSGATYVKIVAVYTAVGPDGWGYNVEQVFEHTFDTSSPGGCIQAPDSGSVAVGACDPNTGRTLITITYTNTLEVGGHPVTQVDLMAYGSSGNAWAIPVTVGRVNDGASVSWTGGLDAQYPVYPSHYIGQFMTLSPHRVLVQEVKFTVPACGDYPLVESGDGGSAGGSSVTPTAKLKLVKCRTGKVNGTLNNKRFGKISRFKLVKKSPGRKPVSKAYKVKPGSVKPVYSHGINSVYKVFWKSKSKGWIKLDRLRTPPQSRCG